MSLLSLQERLDIIEKSQSLGELPLDAMPYTQSDEYYFVSYSHLDYKQVYSDILRLQAAGLNIWYDRGLPAGKNWEEMAEEALTKYACVGVIFYISENSLLSDAVQNEIAFVKRLGKDFLSINMPISIGGSEKICSAEEMLDILGANRNISEGKRAEVLSAFNSKVIYLGYSESTEVKAEKIRLLKRPDLFEYEITEKNYDGDFSLSVLTLKSVNSIDIKYAQVPEKTLFEGKELPVMKIGACAFANCKNLKSVKIPDDISIGESAFFGCTALEKIEAEQFGDIENDAFYGCRNLREIPMFNAGVKSNAFYGCRALEEVTLGNGFHSYSPSIFAGSGISWINQINNDDVYSYFNRSFSLWGGGLISTAVSADMNLRGEATLLFGCPDDDGSYRTPSVTRRIIGGFLPDADAIKSLTLGENVDTIDSFALYGCKNLCELKLADSDAQKLNINEKAFYKTQSLKVLTLPKRTRYIGVGAFERSGLESLRFEEGAMLSEIDDIAFKKCKALAAVEFPATLEKIGRSAFEDCDALERIVLPARLKSIGKKAFADCDALKEVIFSEGLEEIADNAFCANGGLTSLNLPASLKRIGNGAFNQCRNLKSVILPDGLLEIGVSAFRNTAIKEITLPASLKKIQFNAISEIEKITFLGSMEQWQALLITGHGRLEVPVECLDGVYGENTVLEGRLSYELNPDGLGYTVVGIGSYAATHLTVPKSYKGLPVTRIADRAFADAPVKSLAFEGSPDFDKGAFIGNFHIESVDLSNLTKLRSGAFSRAMMLQRVTVGTTLEEIPDECFMSCSELKSIRISSSVKRIGSVAFGCCDELSEVYIESGVEEIGDKAFFGCESLKSVFIPSSVKAIGKTEGRVFFGCSPKLVIDCEADSRPSGWVESWDEKMGSEPDYNPEKIKVSYGKRR